MEKDINMIIKNVVNMMQEELNEEQMHKLENVLYISFHGVKLQEECTSLVTSQSHWDKILKLLFNSLTAPIKVLLVVSNFAITAVVILSTT